MNRIVSLLASMTLALSLFSTVVFAEEGGSNPQSQGVSTSSETGGDSGVVTKEVTGVGVSNETTKSMMLLSSIIFFICQFFFISIYIIINDFKSVFES
ncbi:hypothetical protein [Geobacillus subterraneus]|uniref:Uncharacterized protein n=1 Tax=Geobacillus subterraneus TaxID=129338 RepID=A0A679FXB2_9BACL|nr:hypothetical protein [Geobacillus subterraneus]BBW98757.1 hypothetical protein GsuE55_35900 [Geobacillus subterraneus]